MSIDRTNGVSFTGNRNDSGSSFGAFATTAIGGAAGAGYGATLINVDALLGKDEFIKEGKTPTGDAAKADATVRAARGRDPNAEAEARFKTPGDVPVEDFLGKPQKDFDAETTELEGKTKGLEEEVQKAEKALSEAKTDEERKTAQAALDKANGDLSRHTADIAQRKARSKFATEKAVEGKIPRATAVEHEAGKIRGAMETEVTEAGKVLKKEGVLKFMPSMKNMAKWALPGAIFGLALYFGYKAISGGSNSENYNCA